MFSELFCFSERICKTSQHSTKLHKPVDNPHPIIVYCRGKVEIKIVRLISSKILSFISKLMEIPSEMKDVYQYGIEITISSIFNTILILLCSLALGDIWTGITYLFIFIFLRSFTGGYHATTYLRCNITMVVTFIITFVLYKVITHFAFPISVCEAIALLNLIPIVIFSPVPNKHKPLTDAQKKRSYNLSLIIASVLSLIGLILYTLDLPIGAMIIITVTMVSVLIIIEIFMQRRGYHEG